MTGRVLAECEARHVRERPLVRTRTMRYRGMAMRNPIEIEERTPALGGLTRLLGSTAVTLVAGLAVLAVLGWLAPGDFAALAAKALGICLVIGAAVAGIARLGHLGRRDFGARH